jgi:hypothetical protein
MDRIGVLCIRVLSDRLGVFYVCVSMCNAVGLLPVTSGCERASRKDWREENGEVHDDAV